MATATGRNINRLQEGAEDSMKFVEEVGTLSRVPAIVAHEVELKAPPEIATGEEDDDNSAPYPLRGGGGGDEGIAGAEVSKCSCLKSQCLKLYCECFKEGQYCNDDCVCKDCYNVSAHDYNGNNGGEGIRLQAIRYIVAKKPYALPEEMRAMAYAGGWEPPERPMKSPFPLDGGGPGGRGRKKKDGRKKRKRSSYPSDDYEGAYNHDEDDDDDGESEEGGEGFNAPGGEDEAIPYDVEQFPQLALDPAEDHSSLASSFVRPLFDEPTNLALAIAYTHQRAAAEERCRAQRKKNSILNEVNALREKLQQKKLVLSLANDKVRECNKKVGAWTRKVFDLELEEPCNWNENYRRLKAYREAHGRLPPGAKKCTNEEEKSLSLWVDRIRGQRNLETREEEENEGTTPTGRPKKRNKSNKKQVIDYPHRIECLSNLGVIWESHHGNKWETMFQKLQVYKEEMGTLRFPTDDQCLATGDEDLMALQKWVKSQVLMYRYGKKKNPDVIKRLEGIGFDFETWSTKPGKGKTSKKVKSEGENDNTPTAYDGEVRGDEGVGKSEEIPNEEGQQQQQPQHDATLLDSKMPANEGGGGEAARVQYAI